MVVGVNWAIEFGVMGSYSRRDYLDVVPIMGTYMIMEEDRNLSKCYCSKNCTSINLYFYIL